MYLEHNETYFKTLTDKGYKRAFMRMFVKIIPSTPYKVAREMLRTYRNEFIINMTEYVMLIKWTNLTHGKESGCIEWAR